MNRIYNKKFNFEVCEDLVILFKEERKLSLNKISNFINLNAEIDWLDDDICAHLTPTGIDHSDDIIM